MKKITGLYYIIFCLCLHSIVAAQTGKKPSTKPATPSMSDIQKMMKDLPAEQQAMIKNAMGKPNATHAEPANAALDEWDKAIADATAAIGTVTTKTIGLTGGIIKSLNGKITLNFPEGALTTDMQIGIEETANTALLGCGNAFKLIPEGLTFSKPVLLTLKYSSFDIDGTVPEALNIMTKYEGMWFTYKATKIDTVAKTISIPIMHFSDWGVAAFFKLFMKPDEGKELARGQQQTFYITTIEEINQSKEADEEFKQQEALKAQLEEQKITDDKEKQEHIDDLKEKQQQIKEAQQRVIHESMKALWKKDHPGEEINDKLKQWTIDVEFGGIEFLKPAQKLIFEFGGVEFDDPNDPNLKEILALRSVNKFKGFKIVGWKMNGHAAPVKNEMGELKSTPGYDAKYTAPWVVPLNKIRSVAISCEFINLQSKAKFILVTHVFLTNNGWMSAKIDGNHWSAHQLLDPKYLAAMPGKNLAQITSIDTQYDDGKTVAQIKSASAHYSDGSMGPKGLVLMLTYGFPKTITLRIENPHPGDNIIDCNDEAAVLQTDDWAATLRQFIRSGSGSNCKTSEICKKLTINFKALNLKTGGLVEGTYRCTLYGNNFETQKNSCISSEAHNVSGAFSLSVVSPDDLIKLVPKDKIPEILKPKN